MNVTIIGSINSSKHEIDKAAEFFNYMGYNVKTPFESGELELSLFENRRITAKNQKFRLCCGCAKKSRFPRKSWP